MEEIKDEVIEAILSLDPDKAPGPDGLSIKVYHSFWFLIKKYLL